jgi:Capsule assembly protein Wzi
MAATLTTGSLLIAQSSFTSPLVNDLASKNSTIDLKAGNLELTSELALELQGSSDQSSHLQSALNDFPDPREPIAHGTQGITAVEYKPSSHFNDKSTLSSTYIPMDSWIYPALDRLSSLGYLDDTFFGLRPWTRLSVEKMLEDTADKISAGDNEQATEIYLLVRKELDADLSAPRVHGELDSLYSRFMEISGGKPLTSSFEFGQTIINDDGRPYAQGFNALAGFHGRAEAGRFSLNVRGEYQHAPGYGPLPISAQNTIKGRLGGPGFDVLTPTEQFGVGQRNYFRLLDANLSYHIWGNEISVGKSEMWWGPNQGGAFLWSTNAEPIYMFRINRVEPLYIPFLSRIIGPVRYDNYFGDLKGHIDPRQPWIFGDKISIHPFKDLEIGFSRSCEFAGKGYSVLTFGTFWNCFVSAGDFLQAGQRRYDVGDRRGNFDFRWRLPFLQKSVTIYADSIADDDPSPLANPSRSAWAPGIYISHLPLLPKWDLRVEAPYTNSPNYSNGTYTNHGYVDGFTNKGQIIGYWVGRNSAATQAWLTYWFNPKEQLQFQYRDAKIDRSLWAAGGSQTDLSAKLVKRLSPDVELNAFLQYERYLIPALEPTAQHNFSSSIQITWFPKFQRHF